MDKKTPKDSEVYMSELVLPNDTNLIGNLLGGRLMYWIDIAGALAATKHCRNVVATVQVDSIDFKHPIKRGEMVELYARLTWVGRTSMEVKVDIFSEDLFTGKKLLTNEAYIVFVSLDRMMKPVEVPGLLLENEEQRLEWERAIIRKEHRLRKESSSR